MTTEKQLEMVNTFANKFISDLYPEVDKIEINFKDGRYLEYNIYLNIDTTKESVIDDVDPYYMVDKNINPYIKSFLPQITLPINKLYDIRVYNNKNEEVLNELEFLKTIYDKDPNATGGYMYRQLAGLVK